MNEAEKLVDSLIEKGWKQEKENSRYYICKPPADLGLDYDYSLFVPKLDPLDNVHSILRGIYEDLTFTLQTP